MPRLTTTTGRLVAGLALAGLYVPSRLFHLTLLPMFIDESVYLFWAKRILTEGAFARPLADGKSVEVWLLALVVPFVRDPLFWGRTLSCLAGLLGAWATFDLGETLEGLPAGAVAGGLYLLCPFALFHDRMVLADVFLSTFAAFTLLASISLVRKPTPARGAGLGLLLAACVLCKIPGLIAWTTPLLAALFLKGRTGTARGLLTAFSVAAALSAYPVAYFLTHSAQLQEQAALSDTAGPVEVVVPNLITLLGWLWAYWTPAVCLLFAAGVAAAVVGKRREEALLAAQALVHLGAFALLSRSWFPRYVFPATIPALVLAGLVLVRIWAHAGRARLLLGLALAALLFPGAEFDRALLTRPEVAPFPDVDRFQYVSGWTAGYGRAATARAVQEALEASPGGLVVGVGGESRHGWRPLHLLLRASFMNDPRVTLEVINPLDPLARDALAEVSRTARVLLAVSVDRGSTPPLKAPLVLADRDASGQVATLLYRLSPVSTPH